MEAVLASLSPTGRCDLGALLFTQAERSTIIRSDHADAYSNTSIARSEYQLRDQARLERGAEVDADQRCPGRSVQGILPLASLHRASGCPLAIV